MTTWNHLWGRFHPRRILFGRSLIVFVSFVYVLFLIDPSPVLFAEDGADWDAYRERLRTLAEECDRNQMVLEAKVTRSALGTEVPNGFFFPKWSTRPITELPEDATDAQRKWFERFRAIRTEFGKRFLDRARHLAEEGEGYAAYRTALEGLGVDPDNEELRRILGFRLYQGGWRTEWEIEREAEGLRDHPRFGWIPADAIPRYEAGERLRGDRWVSAKADATGRNRLSKAWRVETEHFEVRTTVSLEAGVRLGRYLEDYYRVWQALFFPMNFSEKEVIGVFEGKKLPRGERHKVVLFRNREEYLTEILKKDPTGGVSSGGYFAGSATVYLYLPDPGNDEETPLATMAAHETTHQLFAESRFAKKMRNRRIRVKGNGGGTPVESVGGGLVANFWITESVATYMETFRSIPGGFRVGGLESYRFLRAKERTEEPEGLLPLAELTPLGKTDFQDSPRLPALYTESAGLASFFFHAEGGRFRQAFLETLFQVYRGEDTPATLSEQAGLPYPELDRLFRDYLQETPFDEERERPADPLETP